MITSACSHKDLYRDLSAGRYTFFEVLYIYFAGTVFSIANFFGLGDSIFDYAIQHQDWGVLLACLHWSHDNGRTYLNKKARFLLTPEKALDNFEFVKYVFDNFNWKSEHFLHVDCNGNTLLHNAVQQLCRRPYSDATDAAALRLIELFYRNNLKAGVTNHEGLTPLTQYLLKINPDSSSRFDFDNLFNQLLEMNQIEMNLDYSAINFNNLFNQLLEVNQFGMNLNPSEFNLNNIFNQLSEMHHLEMNVCSAGIRYTYSSSYHISPLHIVCARITSLQNPLRLLNAIIQSCHNQINARVREEVLLRVSVDSYPDLNNIQENDTPLDTLIRQLHRYETANRYDNSSVVNDAISTYITLARDRLHTSLKPQTFLLLLQSYAHALELNRTTANELNGLYFILFRYLISHSLVDLSFNLTDIGFAYVSCLEFALVVSEPLAVFLLQAHDRRANRFVFEAGNQFQLRSPQEYERNLGVVISPHVANAINQRLLGARREPVSRLNSGVFVEEHQLLANNESSMGRNPSNNQARSAMNDRIRPTYRSLLVEVSDNISFSPWSRYVNYCNEMQDYIAQEYERDKARITINGMTYELPLRWDDFRVFLREHQAIQEQQVLRAYYRSHLHTAYRFFLTPNPWGDHDSAYAPQQTLGYPVDIFSEISLMWLAVKDESRFRPTELVSTIHQRKVLFLSGFEDIMRAHNRDYLNDDNGPDRPSCQGGVMNRLFSFFSAHPFSINGGFIDTTTEAARAPLTIDTAIEELVQFTSTVMNEKIHAYEQGRDHLRDLYEEWRADPSENEEMDGVLGFTDADRARFDTHMTATYPDWATARFKSNLIERLNNQVYYLNDITHDIIQNLLRRSPGSSPSL